VKTRDALARKVQRRFERAGFKVTLGDAAQAIERKKAARRKDSELLASGQATAEQLQRKNSVFGGRQKKFRILDYGGLDEDS
jgi:hypothetical protein